MLHDKTIQAIETFAHHTPDYINKPIHCTDEQRMFDIIKVVIENDDALSEVKEKLEDVLAQKFIHAEELANYISTATGIVKRYMEYVK